jgi:hypothetical protein
MRHIWVPVLVVLMGLGALIGNYGAELGLPTPVLLLGLTLAVAFGGERFVAGSSESVAWVTLRWSSEQSRGRQLLDRYVNRSRPAYASSMPRTAPRCDVVPAPRRTPAGGRPRGRASGRSSSRGSPPDDPDPT